VLFHPDATLHEQSEVIRRHDGVVRDVIESLNGLVVELPFDNIKGLAEEDPVQYVEPALPRMGTTNDSIRALTGVDTVQAAPYGLDGSGVSAMVYDGGTAFASHVDFGGRLTTRDSDSLSTHATHVSGTVGGDGTASGGTNRGMAPGVLIESYGFEYDGSGTFLYTNPGDFEADYGDAIVNWGADVSNNSIGTNTETNGFDCAFQGDYGLMSSLIDAVVRGSVSGGVPHRIVWAAGNERQGSRCDVEGFGDYYSTAPPAGAKNHLSIGALNSNDDSMTSFSSWGPTDDGRLKPDFSAPGCQNGGDGGVTSCSSSSTTSYTVFCGTSMASPTVTGIVALMLQDYRAQFSGPDPRNSTLKALLAHTAVDILNTGPDYQSGYGSVRAPAAIDFMRQENFTESEISQGETLLYTVSVAPSDTELKITLAWSDVPGTPNVTTALVNDLDLHVFSPSSVEHFPWTLNPLIPADLAVQTARDHLNNIEQVQANSPEVGVWLVEIRGFNVPQGPQSFSLCASPNLINCASQGLIALDRSTYNCSSTASVTVVDCDLNTDDFVAETIDVTVTSTSEPGGETLTLTESGTATATFFATLPFSTVDGPGVLQVSEGDSVDTLYIDADDGNGNMGVMNTASASVDCTAPIISNVLVTDVTHIGATIEFDTDEASSALVNFGTDCGSLTEQALAFIPTLHHVVQLGGLNDGQSYAFTVTATDPAGNSTTDDNAGGCYDFMTDDVPDYFTEQFSSFDLDGLSVTYVPNGSDESYVACAEAVPSFPNNPAGGTTLPLSDDDSDFVSIAGGQTVKLYGVSYSSFYVGSNGYITFTGGDTDYTESLSDHFDTPRVSANFDDYNPSVAGTVSWKQLSDRMVVTWENVPEYATSNSNSFQVELFFDGQIRVTYQGMASTDGVAGLSEGAGLPTAFLPSDISEYDTAGCSCPPAMVASRTASGNLNAYTATPPVLGGTMFFTVLAPYSNGLVLATAAQANIPLANGQSLLIDTGASFLFSSAILGLPFGTGQMAVPSDPAFCGRTAATQAILIGPTAGGPPFQLTNAQDVTIGP
jgi:subtilisin family serine protease